MTKQKTETETESRGAKRFLKAKGLRAKELRARLGETCDVRRPPEMRKAKSEMPDAWPDARMPAVYRGKGKGIALWSSIFYSAGRRNNQLQCGPRISYEMIPENILLTEPRGKPSWSRRGETAC